MIEAHEATEHADETALSGDGELAQYYPLEGPTAHGPLSERNTFRPTHCVLCRKPIADGDELDDSKFGIVHERCSMRNRVKELEEHVAKLERRLDNGARRYA